MMQRTLIQLRRQCQGLQLQVKASRTLKNGLPKVLRSDYVTALRDYYLTENYPEGVPQHLQIMLRIESPMLCFRYSELKPEEQKAIWDSDDWILEEKFDGCRMVLIFVRGEGLFFYSRNISVKDFAPINYTNIWHETDDGALGEYFDNFVIDTEVMSENPHVCRLLEERGVPTETVLQAVSSLLALNDEESLEIQRTVAPLCFRAFDVLMVNDDWGVRRMPLSQRRKGLRTILDTLQTCGLSRVSLSEIFQGAAAKQEKFDSILAAGREGVVVKHLNSSYISTTSRDRNAWVKIKRSMKGSLTSTGYGDTLDGWISGFQLGEAGKGWEHLVGAIHVSVYVRDSQGNTREHEIARIPGLSEELRTEMTEIGLDGIPRMKDTYLERVVEIDGQCVSARSYRLKHAKLVRFREDKYKELCVIEEDFMKSMVL